ncbi:hypothetical protein O5190_26900, partial [Escherichia coli]|nr:hypothetical protein [Escherichia coli]
VFNAKVIAIDVNDEQLNPGRIFSEVPAAPELHDKPLPDGVLPSAWIQPPGLWTGPYQLSMHRKHIMFRVYDYAAL